MTNLETINKKILDATHYFVMPVDMINQPFPMTEWEIQDADGVGTGAYYSVQDLYAIYGEQYKPTYVIGGNFFMVRYGIDRDTQGALENYFVSMGLVDVRNNADGTYKDADALDYASFAGNEFLIIPRYMGIDVPK